ncbi:TonB-dependent outer membrane receptor, SusC/RagA subfamily, signature region [Flaviramulus basaltis]|uniref:TonB-dependent outer membrane receptor, SusC/RagA subfamily, signature region n=1 Tax=Flaviramulus basaltis TaxID=369401 RepID=A0A1K2IGX0_9FLAO|nr:TonB-dependent receptor plug domain-containing protein [Flaviramulus basaltis]SFZ91631.1 TonB-dependent outer membrane receptor, SusC/RagA subfamily, signature region [Flaviramulus basaltis]
MKNIASIVLFCIITLFSCKTQKTDDLVLRTAAQPSNEVMVTQAEISLADYLRRISGVVVKGSGDDSIVLVRSGGNSILNSSEPLFLINGNAYNGDFRNLSNIISVADIKSIQVYKDASETSFYGVRGANGVINIKLK